MGRSQKKSCLVYHSCEASWSSPEVNKEVLNTSLLLVLKWQCLRVWGTREISSSVTNLHLPHDERGHGGVGAGGSDRKWSETPSDVGAGDRAPLPGHARGSRGSRHGGCECGVLAHDSRIDQAGEHQRKGGDGERGGRVVGGRVVKVSEGECASE